MCLAQLTFELRMVAMFDRNYLETLMKKSLVTGSVIVACFNVEELLAEILSFLMWVSKCK